MTHAHDRKNLKAEGIILGSKVLGEADKLVSIYTREHGKIRAIAKGAAKPTSRFSGATETLNLCTFELYESSKKTLITDIKVKKNFAPIRESLQKITGALIVTKLTNELFFEGDSLPKIFELIEKTLGEIVKTKMKSLLITATFSIKLLDALGLLPNFKDSNAFHLSLTEKYKRLLNYLKDNPFEKIKKIKLTSKEAEELKEILKKLIENETEKSLKIPL